MLRIARELDGEAAFGMEIEAVRWDQAGIEIVTTGARYDVTPAGIALYRRIDPATNLQSDRLVGSITFERPQPPELLNASRPIASLRTPDYLIDIRPDSLLTIETRRSAPESFYVTNTIRPAPYAAGPGRDDPNRLWTDGYGGFLQAILTGDDWRFDPLTADAGR